MGQNYIGSTYKKTYEGDYVKSYENKSLAKRELEKRVKSYKEITQKEGSYAKQEKGIFDAGNTERTIDILDNSERKISKRKFENKDSKLPQSPIQKKTAVNKTPSTTTSDRPSASTPPPAPKVEIKEQPSVVIKPVEPQRQEEKKTDSTKKTRESKIRNYDAYRSLVMVPVREEASGVYREMINKELIDEKEARKILDYAGYKEKKPLDFIKFGLFALIATVIIQLPGAIGAMAWSYFYRQKTHVTLEKKMGLSNLTISMPANKEEKENIQANGMIYIVISAIMIVVALIRMSVS